MTEEEQNNNERKEPPARKAKTGAWWKSVRATADAEATSVTPPQPAASPEVPAFAAPERDLQTDAPALSMEAPAPGVHHVRIRSLEPGSPPGPWGKPQQIEIPRDYWKTMLLVLPALLFVL